jgi:hypothetical protein
MYSNGNNVKISLIIFLSLLIANFAYPQRPVIDPTFRNNLISQKNRLYQKIIQSETQITTNQEKYDITYYSLSLNPNPESLILTGSVEIVGEVSGISLDHIELNFWTGMNIIDIHMTANPGSQLYYTHKEEILSFNLDKEYFQGEKFSVYIGYNGQPQNSPYGSFDFGTNDSQPMIWTLSEPFGARAWWPCKDVPSDKADSVDIKVTVPSNLIVASNGSLRQKIPNGNETTYWWHEHYPIVTYLVSLAIHPYTVYYDNYLYNNNTDTMKIHFYMFPENYEKIYSLNLQTKDMIGLFADLFGEYPFIDEKYGHADILAGGAMEHQTCSSFGFWDEWVIAHELAHQWWGNFVTCKSFHHIWLNEGFATYSEALWYEYLNGPGTASYYQMTANLYLGPGTVFVEDPQNENIFNGGLSYSKGSWVLHMLRHVVGDNTFFEILHTYNTSELFQYGTATTKDFQEICEQVSGIKLEKFFHQWIYEEHYPQYTINWNWIQNDPNYDIQLEIKQDQGNYLFWMPIDVTVKTTAGESTFVVWDSLESQNFQISVSSEPLTLEIDKNNWILKGVQEPVTDPTFDRGILLVNGVDFDIYDTSIREAYESRAFWGNFPISFWDCFNPPGQGYPSTLPDPLGHGRIPSDILSGYSTVIWIGNNFQGDISAWYQTSIYSYLEAGGNLLLMTRHGQDFINENMRDYLGITWAENTTNTLGNCIAEYQGLASMGFTDIQSLNAVFSTNFANEESILLFRETTSFNEERGLGVWKKPATGGTNRLDGGQFVFISGRPYRYNFDEIRSNSEFILENFFFESKIAGIDDVEEMSIPKTYTLYQNSPNPFNPSTVISYQLSVISEVELDIYNILGEKVTTLVSEKQEAGYHVIKWNASGLTSGIYYYRIKAGNFQDVKKMILLK